MIKIGSRVFSDRIMEQIRETINGDPDISRRQLSLRVCEWMDWKSPSGRLQDVSCRKALLSMHRRGIITLSPLKQTYAYQKRRADPAPPPVAEVACSLSELGKIELVRVRSRPQSALWRGIMNAHHYLGDGPLCGAQLRYLVHSQRYGWIGGFSYSASARHVKCRDEWIGWTEDERVRNRIRVVNNSRFLIAPTVKVEHLASHLLGLCQKHLADDWETQYDYRPVLLETYVERNRFAGTCYRAANWIYLGTTSGRGRQGTGATVKDVYVIPLQSGWKNTLCDGPEEMRRGSQSAGPRAPRDWIEQELGGAKLGDRRLTARLLEMTGMFYGKPTASIPEACGSVGAAKAAYRFLDNPAVDWQAILQSHYEATEERIHEHRLVLAAQDTTTLNYSSHPKTEGLGPISDSEKVRGLIVHDTMAFTPQGTPLGLLDVQCWAREGIGSRHERYSKSINEKESWKWIESYQAVSAVGRRCRKTRLVVMGDREADIHEVFVAHRDLKHGADLLIRAERSRNRKVLDDKENCDFLWTLLEREPVIGTREILVPPSHDRAARQATLEVRTMPVTLRAPKRKPGLGPVSLWAVLAQELNPPTGVEGLEWMLLTTVETTKKEEAYERLEWYARRWGIEVYHRILKSGCRVESRQLANQNRLRNCLAVDMVVAWRIHYLTTLGRETPDVPCTVYFTDSEWKALVTFSKKIKNPPDVPPSLNEAVWLLGKLGGHLGRTGDGNPGTEVLWRGMTRLTDIEVAYNIYQ